MTSRKTGNELSKLSRRETQIMEILYALGPMTVARIADHVPDELSRNAVRTFLTILVGKGELTRSKEGREFIYSPASKKKAVAQDALQKLLDVFFNGSLSDAVAAKFSGSANQIDEEELARLEQLIVEARESQSQSGNP